MGRELMRVPMGFDWPIGKIWPGYMFSLCGAIDEYYGDETTDEKCALCRKFAQIMGYKLVKHYPAHEGCPKTPMESLMEPPNGAGYQLWETTSEGSPMSPVFGSLDELCTWLDETGASWFGGMTAVAETWKRAFEDDTAGVLIATTSEAV